MQLVTMNRVMLPWQANHSYALPDGMARQLIADGTARPAAKVAGDGVTLAPDAPTAPAPKPRNRFLTRGAAR